MGITARIADDLLALHILYHRRILPAAFGPGTLRGPHYRVLAILMKQGPLPISEVGKCLLVSRPYMTGLIDHLEREGCVQRIPDPADRRVIQVALTDEGREYLIQAARHFREEIGKILLSLGEDDQQRLCSSLRNLMDLLGKISWGDEIR